jgi:hypothetical protein
MLLMEQVMTRCKVKTICMKKWNRSSAAKHQKWNKWMVGSSSTKQRLVNNYVEPASCLIIFFFKKKKFRIKDRTIIICLRYSQA